ncbi:MAG TPA: hypothetical protein VFL99_02915 [Segeticoccus sp.]|uniref:hypothetical protein n=1 Tax=Segeticoccus sp. TaxID=2706531 RepID=UPI002D7FDD90|nr:hypothetical protein [Segeticoccus sp.]HET8599250.1 hypothetical protein [Segeticoccus sp.]
MTPQLSVLEVPADAEELYRRVLRMPNRDLRRHAAELGWPMEKGQEALTALVHARLVRVGEDGGLVADHPRAALERLIEAEESRLDSRRRDLSGARNAIAGFTSDHQVGQQGPGPRQPTWESIPAAVAPSVVDYITRSTTGVIRNCVHDVDIGPATEEENIRTGQAILAAGREQRTIYPMSVLSHAPARDWMRSWAAVGEQQRVSDDPPSDFAVFGEEVLVASEAWATTNGDYVVVRDPMVVAAFSALFDRLWAAALPLPDEDDTGADLRLLELMALGFKDEAIARYLGLSLRTVRRRIAGLMNDHAVSTRFQLGMAAQRRGVLDGAGRHT